MHIGLLGTMAQLFLADLREKTWRGQLGRALQGKGEIIRSLLERIELLPTESGMEMRLHGDLVRLLAFSAEAEKHNGPADETGPLLSVVAGTRIDLYRTVVPLAG